MEQAFASMMTDTVTIEKRDNREESGARRSFQDPVLYKPGTQRGGCHISSKQKALSGTGSQQIIAGGAVYLPPDDVSTTLTPEDRLTFGDATGLDSDERDDAEHKGILLVATPRDENGVHHVTVFIQ